MDAILYVRWSSAEQSRGSSRERQIELCREHAKKKGWRIIDTMVDEGVSAFTGKNRSSGKLAQFVADVEADRFPDGVVLLTEKLDRLSRQEPGQVFIWMMNVTEAGVTIATVDGDRLYRRGSFDMAGIIEVVVKAQLAHEESAKKAERLAAAWQSKRRRIADGERLVMTRRAPAWVTVKGSPASFVLIEDRAAIVRRIFEETVAGWGKASIARRLNAEGVNTFGRASGWHASYIQKILNSGTVLGAMQPGRKPRGAARELVGDPIEGYYPAVIDADLHARAMRAMAGRSRRVGGRGRRLVNIFAGLARCNACGSKLTFRSKGEKTRADGTKVNEDYLVCDSYQRGRGCVSSGHYNYGAWEGAILNAILIRAMDDRHFASHETVRALEIEKAEAERQRDAAAHKRAAAMELFLETGESEVKERWSTLRVELDDLEIKLADLRGRITAARGAVSPDEHRQRIAELFEQMEDDDEPIRFEARSRVMEAVHELVTALRFNTTPPVVTVVTTGALICEVEHTDGRGPDANFTYRFDEGFFPTG